MTRPTDSEISASCDAHGTKAVYDAAYRRMAGDHSALPKVDLPDVLTIGDADYIGRIAFRLLSPEDKAGDLAAVSINLAKLP